VVRAVADLVRGRLAVGYHEVQFDASGLASGTYIAGLQAGAEVFVKRIVLTK